MSSVQLRRSNRRKKVSKRHADSAHIDPMKFDFNKQEFYQYDKLKTELNQDEKDLLLTPAKPNDKERYCFCRRTEAEAPNTIMIGCDICENWFHGECVNLTKEEMDELQFFACPDCSSGQRNGGKYRFEPAQQEIEMLINLMDNSNDVEPFQLKKTSRFPPPNISLYHLDECVSTGQFLNVIGYIINNNHSNPTIQNGFLVPITQDDLNVGFINTSWGSFTLSSNSDGLLSISKNYNAQSPVKTNGKSNRHQTVPFGALKICRNGDQYDYQFENLEMLPLKRYKQIQLPDKIEALSWALTEKNIDLDQQINVKPTILKP